MVLSKFKEENGIKNLQVESKVLKQNIAEMSYDELLDTKPLLETTFNIVKHY